LFLSLVLVASVSPNGQALPPFIDAIAGHN
jgi:hypothetical protein